MPDPQAKDTKQEKQCLRVGEGVEKQQEGPEALVL